MIKFKHILVFSVFVSLPCFSQTTFNNIDSLLTKNFEAVNKRDSVYYVSLINKPFLFIDKNIRSKSDSLTILKPFTDAFRDLIDELADMTGNSDYTVKYLSYEFRNKNTKIKDSGPLSLHVQLLINNTFTIKMPMVVNVSEGHFSINSPMSVMFLEGKE